MTGIGHRMVVGCGGTLVAFKLGHRFTFALIGAENRAEHEPEHHPGAHTGHQPAENLPDHRASIRLAHPPRYRPGWRVRSAV